LKPQTFGSITKSHS